MVSRRVYLGVLFLMILPLILTGCDGDDGVTPPAEFTVVLQVVDSDGTPVAGLQLGLAPDSPFYMDGKSTKAEPFPFQIEPTYSPNPFYPVTHLAFSLADISHVLLKVEDVARGDVAVLVDEIAAEGSHSVAWAGCDQNQEPVPSGVYYAHLVATVPGSDEVLVNQSQALLLAAFYAEQVLIGTTDQMGRIVLEDKRLFPYLFDVEPFTALDEEGNVTGTITLTPTMRFYLTDPGTGQTSRYLGDVEGATELEFIWEPVG